MVKLVHEWYTDCYGCNYKLTRDLRTDICQLIGWTARTHKMFVGKKYSTYRGARIALGKYSEGTARKEETV